MKNNEKASITIIFHIAFVILLISIFVFLYRMIGGKENALKETNKMYENKIEKTQKVQSESQINKELLKKLTPFKKYNFKYTYTLDIRNSVRDINFKVQIPVDEKERQYISNFKITPNPIRIYNDGINNIAEFEFNNISDKKIPIVIEGLANVRTYDLKTAKILNKNFSKESDLTRYLQPEELIDSNDNYIKNIAKNIKGDTQEEIVLNIYNYTQDAINYTILPYNISAKAALMNKKGKCTEFAVVMVALLRAKNIPARVVCGNIARDKFQPHNWVEVYFDKYGWVTFDPTNEATIVNIYNQGKLVLQEKRRKNEDNDLKYIASSRNSYSPVFYNYTMTGNSMGKIYIDSNILITEEQ